MRACRRRCAHTTAVFGVSAWTTPSVASPPLSACPFPTPASRRAAPWVRWSPPAAPGRDATGAPAHPGAHGAGSDERNSTAMTTSRFYGPLVSSFSERVRARAITKALACMKVRSPIRGMADVCAQLDLPVVEDGPDTVAAFCRRSDRIPEAVFVSGQELSATDAERKVMKVLARPAKQHHAREDVVFVSRAQRGKVLLRAGVEETSEPRGLLARGIWWVFGAPGAKPVAVLWDGEVVTDHQRFAEAKSAQDRAATERARARVATARKKLGLTG